ASVSVAFYSGATHDFDDPGERRQSVPGNVAAKADAMAKAAALVDGARERGGRESRPRTFLPIGFPRPDHRRADRGRHLNPVSRRAGLVGRCREARSDRALSTRPGPASPNQMPRRRVTGLAGAFTLR